MTTSNDSLGALLWAVGQQESGGNYSDVNSSSGALGKYQVMPSNVADWTRRALGHSETPVQFLNDPNAQEAVARTVLGDYYSRYGAAGAAAEWYSGQPDPTKTYGTPSVADYVHQVLDRMRGAPTGAGTQPAGTQPTGFDVTGGLGGAISSVTETIKNLAIVSPFIIAGAVLVVLGLAHATGADKAAKQKGEQAVTLAAMA